MEMSCGVSVPLFVSRATLFNRAPAAVVSRADRKTPIHSIAIEREWSTVPGGISFVFSDGDSRARPGATTDDNVAALPVAALNGAESPRYIESEELEGRGASLAITSPGMGLEAAYVQMVFDIERERMPPLPACDDHFSIPPRHYPLLHVLVVPDALLPQVSGAGGGVRDDNAGDAYLSKLQAELRQAFGILSACNHANKRTPSRPSLQLLPEVVCVSSGMSTSQRADLYSLPHVIPPSTGGTALSKGVAKDDEGRPRKSTVASLVASSANRGEAMLYAPTKVVIVPASFMIADVLHKRISLDMLCASVVVWMSHDLRWSAGGVVGGARSEPLLSSLSFISGLCLEAQDERHKILRYYISNPTHPSPPSIECSLPPPLTAKQPSTRTVVRRRLPHMGFLSDAPVGVAGLLGVHPNIVQVAREGAAPNSSTTQSVTTLTKRRQKLTVHYSQLKRFQELLHLSNFSLFPWFRHDIIQIRSRLGDGGCDSTWQVEELFVKCTAQETELRQALLHILRDLLSESHGALQQARALEVDGWILHQQHRHRGEGENRLLGYEKDSQEKTPGQLRREGEAAVDRKLLSAFRGVAFAEVTLDDLAHSYQTGLYWRLRDFTETVSRSSVVSSIEVSLMSQQLNQPDHPDRRSDEYEASPNSISGMYQRLRVCAQAVTSLLDVLALYFSSLRVPHRSRYGAAQTCFLLEDTIERYHEEYSRALLGASAQSYLNPQVVFKSRAGRQGRGGRGGGGRGTTAVRSFTGINAGSGSDVAQFSAALWISSPRFAALRRAAWGLLLGSPRSTPQHVQPHLCRNAHFSVVVQYLSNWIHTLERRREVWTSSDVATFAASVMPSALVVFPDETTLRRFLEFVELTCSSSSVRHRQDRRLRGRPTSCPFHGQHPINTDGMRDSSPPSCPDDEWSCLLFCRALVRLGSRERALRSVREGLNIIRYSTAVSNTFTGKNVGSTTTMLRPHPSSSMLPALGTKRPRHACCLEDGPDQNDLTARSEAPVVSLGRQGTLKNIDTTAVDVDAGEVLYAEEAEDEDDELQIAQGEEEETDVRSSQISVLKGIVDIVVSSSQRTTEDTHTSGDSGRVLPESTTLTSSLSTFPPGWSTPLTEANANRKTPAAASSTASPIALLSSLWEATTLAYSSSSTVVDVEGEATFSTSPESVRAALVGLYKRTLHFLTRHRSLVAQLTCDIDGLAPPSLGGIGGDASLGAGFALRSYEDVVARIFSRLLFPCLFPNSVVSACSNSDTIGPPPTGAKTETKTTPIECTFRVTTHSPQMTVLTGTWSGKQADGVREHEHEHEGATARLPMPVFVGITTEDALSVTSLTHHLLSKYIGSESHPLTVHGPHPTVTSANTSSPPHKADVINLDSDSDNEVDIVAPPPRVQRFDSTRGSASSVTTHTRVATSFSVPKSSDTHSPQKGADYSFANSTVRRLLMFDPSVTFLREVEVARLRAATFPSSPHSALDPLSRGVTKAVLIRDADEVYASQSRTRANQTSSAVVDVDSDDMGLIGKSTNGDTGDVIQLSVRPSEVSQAKDLDAFEVLMKAKRDMPNAMMVSLSARRSLQNNLAEPRAGRTTKEINTQRRVLTAAVQKASSSSATASETIAMEGSSTAFASSGGNNLVIVDDREFRASLPFFLFHSGLKLCPLTLLDGDYVLSPICAMERKSFADFNQSLAKGRLQEQLVRLSRRYTYPILLLEDSNYPSCMGGVGSAGPEARRDDDGSSSSTGRPTTQGAGSGGGQWLKIKALMEGTMGRIPRGGEGGDDAQSSGGDGLRLVYRFRQTSSSSGSDSGGGSVSPFLMCQLYKRFVLLITSLPTVIWMWSRSAEHSAQMVAQLKLGAGATHEDGTQQQQQHAYTSAPTPTLLSTTIASRNPDVGDAALTVRSSESELDGVRTAIRMLVKFPGVSRSNVMRLMSAARSLAGLASMSKQQLCSVLDSPQMVGASGADADAFAQIGGAHFTNGERLYHFLHTSYK